MKACHKLPMLIIRNMKTQKKLKLWKSVILNCKLTQMQLLKKVRSMLKKRSKQLLIVWTELEVLSPNLIIYLAKKRSKLNRRQKISVVLGLMRMCKLKFATWVTVAGLIIILLLKFKLDNIVHQKLLLELTTIHLLMFGRLLVLFLR